MFYALAHLEETFLADSLLKFVAFAPCTLFETGGVPESYYASTIYRFPSIGVPSMY